MLTNTLDCITMRRIRAAPVGVLALFVCACAGGAVQAAPLPHLATRASLGVQPDAIQTIGGTRVELLTDGAAAAVRLRDAIAGAQRRVDAEIYEFARTDIADAMIGALGRGVRVTLVEDPTVDVNAATAARLRQAGAQVLIFPDQARQIDHVKLLIVDGASAIFGGMNWGAESWRNHDFDLAVTGPLVSHLEAIFAADVVRCGGRAIWPAAEATDPPTFKLLRTYPEAEVRPVALEEIAKARSEIFIEMYVMTDSAVIAALSDAARRGVAVFVLFDPNQDLNQLAATRLRQAGVQARFYRSHGEKLHAKAMEVDRAQLLVGSANWSSSGFLHNHELDAAVESPALTEVALVRMEADWRASP